MGCTVGLICWGWCKEEWLKDDQGIHTDLNWSEESIGLQVVRVIIGGRSAVDILNNR